MIYRMILDWTSFPKPMVNPLQIVYLKLSFWSSYPHPPILHSDKFEMTEEVDSLLSEKVSNFLLTWKVNSNIVDNKSGGLDSSWLYNLTKLDSGRETLRKYF